MTPQHQARRLVRLYGWTPEAIKHLIENHRIPTTASDRTLADWQHLIALLRPAMLCPRCGAEVAIPGVDFSYCDLCGWMTTNQDLQSARKNPVMPGSL